MANLLDTIRKNLQAPTQAPTRDETGEVRRLLRAKTGKAIAPGAAGAPRQSSLQEKMAQTQTQLGAEQLQQRGEIQAAQLEQREADITQQEEQQAVRTEEKRQDLQQDIANKTIDLVNQFQLGQKSLKNSKDIRDIEQLGFNLRLENEQYINNLQLAGEQARLDNKLNFKTELAKSIMGEKMNMFVNDQVFKAAMDADRRDFSEAVAKLSLDDALDMAELETKSRSAQMTAEGVSGVVSGGLKGLDSLFGSEEKGKGNPELTEEGIE